jgi:hypothetical protein
MKYDKKLLFMALLVITIILITEIIVYHIVASRTTNVVTGKIDWACKNIAKKYKKMSSNVRKNSTIADVLIPRANSVVFNSKTDSLLKANAKSESKLINKINDYAKVISFILIIVLLYALMKLYNNDWYKDASYVCITTIVVLIIFQSQFYSYIKKYKLIGTNGKEELYDLALRKLNMYSKEKKTKKTRKSKKKEYD